MTTTGTGTGSRTQTGAGTRTLVQCEAQINKSNLMAGEAFKEIRDRKLHQESSFEDYCSDKWGFSKRHVNRIIRAYEILIEQKAHLGPLESIFTEKHYRQIARLEDEASRTVAIRQIREQCGKSKSVTAEQVKEVVDEISAQVSPSKATKARATKPVEEEEFDEDDSEAGPRGPDAETEKLLLDDFDAALSVSIRLLVEQYRKQYEHNVLIERAQQVIKRLSEPNEAAK